MLCRSALLLASFLGVASGQLLPDSAELHGALTIVLRSDSAASPEVLTAMKSETESLLDPSSIRLAWTTDSDGTQVFDRVAVVHLRGACRVDGPLPGTVQKNEPLGRTQVVNGKVLPFADVRCNPVRKLIAHDLAFEPSAEREELLGRALGRVLAHELYHILLRTTSHGGQGLARPAQSSSDLLASSDSFAPVDERKLSLLFRSVATKSFVHAGQ